MTISLSDEPISLFVVFVVYALAEIYKIIITPLQKKTKLNLKRFIPLICGILGGIIGLFIFYIDPSYSMGSGDSVLNYITSGIISGIASTGLDQMLKQIFENNNVNKEEDKPNNSAQ